MCAFLFLQAILTRNLVKLVKMSIEEMRIEDKAELLIAVRNYKCEKGEKWAEGMDYTASDKTSDKKVLLRSIEPQG